MDDRNFKNIIDTHTKSSNFDPPLYHCQQDSVHLPCNYYCSLVVCGQTFSTISAYQSKDQAELQAAKLACDHLNLTSAPPASKPNFLQTNNPTSFHTDDTYDQFYIENSIKRELQTPQKQNPYQNKMITHRHPKQPTLDNRPGTRQPKQSKFGNKSATEVAQHLQSLSVNLAVGDSEEAVPVSSIEEVWAYMHGDVLASSFKSLVHLYCQMEQCPFPKFTQSFSKDTGINLCTSTLLFKGQTFHSIGPMQNRKQADLSAAEVCLRSLGYLPQTTSCDQYTIQPYNGGKILHLMEKQRGKSNVLLHEIAILQCLRPLLHRLKEVQGPENGDSAFLGHSWLDDKMFIADMPVKSAVIARHKALTLALKYFNVKLNNQNYSHFSTMAHKKEEFKLKFTSCSSPFVKRPSENLGWIHDCLKEPSPVLDGRQISEEELKEKLTIAFFEGENKANPYEAFVTQQPTFQCNPLKDMKDLMVCKVGGSNPNVVLVGNKDFSINMLCQGQKLLSNNRGCPVKLLPGHNISEIECEYVITQSNDIYIQARSCYDLYLPNRPKPVVRSCSVVLIMHDQEAGDYPYVLFARSLSANGFPAASVVLSEYLSSLITGDTDKKLDITRLVSSIQYWTLRELELLSQMTMDSMYDLYNEFTKYDSRWNEVFMDTPTSDLAELKTLCTKELERRKVNNAQVKEENIEWQIPKFDFKPRLLPTGPYVEDSVMCAMRGFQNMTGVKLKLGDFDDIPYVDVPVTDPGYRGASDRYYIWAKTVTDQNKDNYLSKTCVDLFDDKIWTFSKKSNKKQTHPSKRPLGGSAKDSDAQPNGKHARSENNAQSTESTGEITEDNTEDEQVDYSTSAILKEQIECKWFCITTAPNMNESFKQLIESPTFATVMTEMKDSQ